MSTHSNPSDNAPATAERGRKKRPGRRLLGVAGAGLAALAVLGVGAFALAGGIDKTVSERVAGSGAQVVRVALVDAAVGFDVTPDETNFQHVVSLSPLLSDDLQALAMNITEPGRLADFIASSLATLSTAVKQEVLETVDVRTRLDLLNRLLIKEAEVLELGSKIQSQVQSEVGKNQREYFLREQMKAIQKELGEGDDQTKEIEELREKIEAAGMPEAVEEGSQARARSPVEDAGRGRGVHRLAHLSSTGSSRCRGRSEPTK